MSVSIPAGFEPVDFKSPFMEVNGPVYARVDAPILHLGIALEQRHCNLSGSIHGGMLATLADFAMGRALARSRPTEQRLVTLNLNLDYIGTAEIGAWLEMHVQLKKAHGNIAFATCDIRDGDRIVVTSSGVFKFL